MTRDDLLASLALVEERLAAIEATLGTLLRLRRVAIDREITERLTAPDVDARSLLRVEELRLELADIDAATPVSLVAS